MAAATFGSVPSIKAYGKVNEADQERLEARQRTRKRIVIISLSTVILVAVIVAAVLGTGHGSSDGKSKSADPGPNSLSTSIKAVCQLTQYPDSCHESLSHADITGKVDPQSLFQLSMQVAMDAILKASKVLQKLGASPALADCQELLDLAVDQINGSLSTPHITLPEAVEDLKTWLSAAGTYLDTCVDGFGNTTEQYQVHVAETLKNSTEFTSNSLAILSGIFNVLDSFKMRRLMSHPSDELPYWMSSKDRKLLQSSDRRKTANIVVAKDGSSRYKTIKAALEAVPDKSKDRFIIYVKKGIYNENVRVEKSKWNVMMVGDGKDATRVSGSENFVDGTPTFQTATFAVFGRGFIASDMGFFNTAGASKHQAVALMTDSDQSIYYRCRVDAYQDSLYVHSLRQFFRECDIYGTVDFIFGNAAAVLQNCNIRPRVPMKGQQDTITAQGKVDPNQNTGISIHNCSITPFGNMTSVRTYLGRPWKAYSTTIFMKSMLDKIIDPTGWMPWTGTSAPDTIFYAEFQNYGPGSSTKDRVKWKGLRFIKDKQAQKFTVKSFIHGDKWISKAGVKFTSGL
ncbi:putative pectinesterase/pectinesterase inhibitor 24 [Aristolochia californica]|uniref:putative pectinesterase/pectinesterase inhibitor 24 n=1 Tax=Aristolochia californica TaxID=171875 RepID=UPI0035E11731